MSLKIALGEWVNSTLPDEADQVDPESWPSTFVSGTSLHALLSSLYPDQYTRTADTRSELVPAPTNKTQRLVNVKSGLAFLTDALKGFPSPLPASEDQVVEGDETAVIELVWSIFIHSTLDGEGASSSSSSWVKSLGSKLSEGMEGKISNFKGAWSDGLLLAKFIASAAPALLDGKSLDKGGKAAVSEAVRVLIAGSGLHGSVLDEDALVGSKHDERALAVALFVAKPKLSALGDSPPSDAVWGATGGGEDGKKRGKKKGAGKAGNGSEPVSPSPKSSVALSESPLPFSRPSSPSEPGSPDSTGSGASLTAPVASPTARKASLAAMMEKMASMEGGGSGTGRPKEEEAPLRSMPREEVRVVAPVKSGVLNKWKKAKSSAAAAAATTTTPTSPSSGSRRALEEEAPLRSQMRVETEPLPRMMSDSSFHLTTSPISLSRMASMTSILSESSIGAAIGKDGRELDEEVPLRSEPAPGGRPSLAAMSSMSRFSISKLPVSPPSP